MNDYIVINVGLNDELNCNVRLDEGRNWSASIDNASEDNELDVYFKES